MTPTLVRHEVRTFASRYLDQVLMYPGKWQVMWIKTPFMPWICAGMQPFGDDVDPLDADAIAASR